MVRKQAHQYCPTLPSVCFNQSCLLSSFVDFLSINKISISYITILYTGLEASSFASDVNVAPDLRRALSLLSTSSWGLNDSEGNALDQLMHVNRSSVAQPAVHAELQNWDFSSSGHQQVEQPPPESRARSLNYHNNGSGHYQEFQLFKSSYESGCFYSNQIN